MHSLKDVIAFNTAHAEEELKLISLAYAYEQATKRRRPPTFAPSADVQH